MTDFYTYFHTRNDTGAVFYVGKGCGSRCRKSGRHNPHWKNIVAKYGRTVHLARTHLTEAEAFEHEKFLTLCFKDMGVPLVNCTEGGEGPSGMVHTPEVRASISAKMSALLIGNKRNLGRKVSEKTMVMMIGNKYRLGTKHTAEWCARQSEFRHSDETKAKMSADRMGNQYARGHKDTLEQTAKRKLRVVSPETRAKISAATKGKPKPRRIVRPLVLQGVALATL